MTQNAYTKELDKMRVLKLGPECLTADYKMLTDEAKQKIFDIYNEAEEKTIIELPEGFLFLNITDDDVPEDFEWDAEKALLKVSPTILGYTSCEAIFGSLMVPSFLEGTTIDSDMVSEYYESEPPQRKFAIGGAAHAGSELFYSKVEDESEARKRADSDREDPIGSGDYCYSTVPFSTEPTPNYCWSLHIEGLTLDLYTDDPEHGAMFEIDGVELCLIHAEDDGNALFESETGNSAYVRKKEWRHITRPVDSEEDYLDTFDPRLLSVHGSFKFQLWTLRYSDENIEWTHGGDDQENDSFFYFDGNNYNEITDNSSGEDDFDFPDDDSESSERSDASDSIIRR